ncbi:MAG: VWA domain-containing protein [Magnetococcales bacterium]|nr:VWA domain-containing protein [Magnetococcales bacterium]
MSEPSFAHPEAIHLLWAILGLMTALFILDRRARRRLSLVIAPPLQTGLVSGPGRVRRGLGLFFTTLTLVFLTIALMRPQWGTHQVITPRSGANLMVCLDVSKSMLAEDVAPNRLERAKAELRDLLSHLHGHQVGLILFAGRATVVSPLTPDFGFFRLALDQAAPNSVSRGGTRLEEPIRKAIAGLNADAGVSRSILLITDGEDQDSFPLEAAHAAAERGIRILAIGFGDEAGSAIPITDHKTRTSSLLRDANGQVVKSRLDGDLLRQIARITDGAYIPAGTGVLDLKAIHDRHIAPLTRGAIDGTRRTVGNEVYPWAVLSALVSLLAAVATTSGRGGPDSPPWMKPARNIGLLLLGVFLSLPSANAAPATKSQEGKNAREQQTTATGSNITPQAANETKRTAREEYNLGLVLLGQKNYDSAMEHLTKGRDQAETDGTLRLRATHALGWAEAERAATQVAASPEEALRGIHRAASWFREALELDPTHEESRYNLEIVSRRALALADAMATTGKNDIAARLEALIVGQRALLDQMTPLIGEGSQEEETSPAMTRDPKLKQSLRDLAAGQLELLSQGEDLGSMATLEQENLSRKGEGTPDDRLRRLRLERMLADLHEARERMTQGRGALRRGEGIRAFRRATVALARLKQARERLAELPSRLATLSMDAAELAGHTRSVAHPEGEKDSRPPGYTTTWLREVQEVLSDRTRALREEIATGLNREETASTPTPPVTREPSSAKADETSHHDQTHLLEKALPLIDGVARHFASAQAALGTGETRQALEHQEMALQGLETARALFFSLEDLIERSWLEEERIRQHLREDPSLDKNALPSAMTLQEANIERMRRIGARIDERLRQARASGPPGTVGTEQPAADTTTANGVRNEEVQRLERAKELAALASERMDQARQDLRLIQDRSVTAPLAPMDPGPARVRVDVAVAILDELRQLFFSIVQHLQRTAQRQQDLADETRGLEPLTAEPEEKPLKERAGPLGERQRGLARTTHAIRESLEKQRDAMSSPPQPSAPAIQGDPGSPAENHQTSPQAAPAKAGGPPPTSAQTPETTRTGDIEKLGKAIVQVDTAEKEMEKAALSLDNPRKQLESARGSQEAALVALAEALALLSPPDQNDPSKNKEGMEKAGGTATHSENGAKEAGDKEKKGEEASGQEPRRPSPTMEGESPLLQGIRDREALRQRQRGARGTMKYEPVEKDW